MSSTRNHHRLISFEEMSNIFLYYTVAQKSDDEVNIKVILAYWNSEKLERLYKICKYISHEKGSEDDYRIFLEGQKAALFGYLSSKLKALEPETYQKLKLPHNNNSPLTFEEFYDAHKQNIAKLFQWAPSTFRQYDHTLKNQIAPLISDKPMYQLSFMDYSRAINTLREKRLRSKQEPYSESRIKQFWANTSCVVEYACIAQICSHNSIKGVQNLNPIERTIKQQNRRKSLTTKESSIATEFITNSFLQDGRLMGTALQYYTGLRPSEACSLNFRDICHFRERPSRCYLRIYTQCDRKGQPKKELKTPNGYRYIPITKELQYMIEMKHNFLISNDFTEEEIAEMPIANRPPPKRSRNSEQNIHLSYKRRCNSNDLSKCGKTMLNQAIGKIVRMEVPTVEDEKITEVPIEHDVEAYMLRRNFCTRMFGICGLSNTEVQYMMGHVLEYDMYGRPNDYVNEDMLLSILDKMDRFISIPDMSSDNKEDIYKNISSPDPRKNVITIYNTISSPHRFENDVEKHFSLEPSPFKRHITVALNSKEPGDAINVNISSDVKIEGTVVSIVGCNQTEPMKTTNVLSRYYDELFSEEDSDYEPLEEDEESGEEYDSDNYNDDVSERYEDTSAEIWETCDTYIDEDDED